MDIEYITKATLLKWQVCEFLTIKEINYAGPVITIKTMSKKTNNVPVYINLEDLYSLLNNSTNKYKEGFDLKFPSRKVILGITESIVSTFCTDRFALKGAIYSIDISSLSEKSKIRVLTKLRSSLSYITMKDFSLYKPTARDLELFSKTFIKNDLRFTKLYGNTFDLPLLIEIQKRMLTDLRPEKKLALYSDFSEFTLSDYQKHFNAWFVKSLENYSICEYLNDNHLSSLPARYKSLTPKALNSVFATTNKEFKKAGLDYNGLLYEHYLSLIEQGDIEAYLVNPIFIDALASNKFVKELMSKLFSIQNLTVLSATYDNSENITHLNALFYVRSLLLNMGYINWPVLDWAGVKKSILNVLVLPYIRDYYSLGVK